MSKRGRRRHSKRRKSSSSSKQSVSPYIFQKQNNRNSVSYQDDIVEKGETDSFRKENVLSGSEDEEKYNNAPFKDKKMKQDQYVKSFPKQGTVYTKTTEDKEKGVKIVTSVSVNDVEDSSPKIVFQQTHEPLSENPTRSSTPVTNIMKINCSRLHLKLEIQEILQLSTCGIKTTFVFTNEEDCEDTLFNSKCERPGVSNTGSSEKNSQNVSSPDGNQNRNYRFTFGSMSEQTEAHSESVSSTKIWDSQNNSQYGSNNKNQISDFIMGNHQLSNIKSEGKHFHKNISTNQFWDIPPPQEFADIKYNSIGDLTHDLTSCVIGACSSADKQRREFHLTANITSNEDSGLSLSFAHLSDNYEPMFQRPSLCTNRYSFTKDFINYQKRKSWIRNNSIAKNTRCLLPKKRRQTFPGLSDSLELMHKDLLLPYTESLSPLIAYSLPLQTEGLGNGDDQCSAFRTGNPNYPKNKGSSKHVSEIPNSHDGKESLPSPFYMTSSEENSEDMLTNNKKYQGQNSIRYYHKGYRQQDTDFPQGICQAIESLDMQDCGYKVDQAEISQPLTEERSGGLTIQVIPPSCGCSEEQILQSHPAILLQNSKVKNTSQEDFASVLLIHKSSVKTVTVGALKQGFLHLSSRTSPGGSTENHIGTALENPCMSPLQDLNVHSLKEAPKEIEEKNNLHSDGRRRDTEDSDKPEVTASCPAKGSKDTEIHSKEQLYKSDKTDKRIGARCSLDKEHLKPVAHKDSESSGSDHCATRRKLFRESKQWSSAGGSSITSDITEESVSEDTRSLDMTIQDNEDRCFYKETFYCSAWIYQGDDEGSEAIPPGLSTKPRAVSIRERTVKINKGTGEYPWGFRIQFSKPIVVTEVDTNGAAEEAGLMVGDYVLAVNGTDVTSIPHSEAASLARQGPDLLTLTVGSDIARCPNTPRPACRGYLHKRTQSGLIKGWRKRWFVLTHDCCLYYYKHKRDQGKRRALSAVKLEGAEVAQDTSLGKPFVFRCCPQCTNRVYFFCATSNQEMKRWLEAMEKAIHPITQKHIWEDVNRHNSNLPPLAVKNPECLGLLHKMDKSKDMWVQHYCILKDGCLTFYSSIRSTCADGGIYLQGYRVRELPYGSKKSTIELKPPSDEFKTFYICAENPSENKRWIIAITASIKKWLPLHQALQDYMNQPPEETRM